MNTNNRTRRAGFTLTELIVAMSIILVLAAVAVGIIPRLGHQERAARGADLVQRWLLIAKQRALSERTPVGIRLIEDTATGTVTQLQYIYEPEPYSKGKFVSGGPTVSTFDMLAEFDGGGGLVNADEAPVQPGDYLEVYGGGLVTQITAVGPNQLTHLAATPRMPANPTSNYKIYRQPRRMQGEAPLVLPKDIAIDVMRSPGIPRRTVNGVIFYEVLFSPAGGVTGKGTTADKIILWVRDVSFDQPTQGSPTLIVVYTRTGLIAAHPVDIGNPADPYSFTRNPRSSGL